MKQYQVRISRYRTDDDGEDDLRTNEFTMQAHDFAQAVYFVNARIAGNREGMPDAVFEIVSIRVQGLGKHFKCVDGWRTADEITAAGSPITVTGVAEADDADVFE